VSARELLRFLGLGFRLRIVVAREGRPLLLELGLARPLLLATCKGRGRLRGAGFALRERASRR
jgi:hypothetical protein